MNILNDLIQQCAKAHATTEEVLLLWKMGKCANVCALLVTQTHRVRPELDFRFCHPLAENITSASFKMVKFLM